MLTLYGLKCRPEGYGRKYKQMALEMIRDGRIHADRLISHGVPLRDIGKAFEVAVSRQGLKAVVRCGGGSNDAR